MFKSNNGEMWGETKVLSSQCQVLIIRSVSSLPYYLGKPFLVLTLMMEAICEYLCIFHRYLMSVSWYFQWF